MKERIRFAIVGSGWRAECYLAVAHSLPSLFEVCGVVVRSEAKREVFRQKWGITTYSSLDLLFAAVQVDFIVVAVSKGAAPGVITAITEQGIPVLAETPPADNLKDLIELNVAVGREARIQIAEQYHVQPMHAARLAIIDSGLLGDVNFAHVSISHGYHGVSLLRKILGVGFCNCTITAVKYQFPSVEGPGRSGLPLAETIVNYDHTIAVLNFYGRVGLFDFEKNQHRSWHRSNRILMRGSHGEINSDRVKYLQDYATPIEWDLKRLRAGDDENLEGFYLKGILAGERWMYRNSFIPARLSDDEIAIATTLKNMAGSVYSNQSFYSLSEASQDQYLALMIEKAIETGHPIQTDTQCWAL